MAKWLFSKLPPDGSRSGGDPAAHAFEHSVEAFVREVIQNANDQGRGGGVEVEFRFRDLSGPQLEAFFEGADWEGLRPHLDAVAKTDKGRAIEDTLVRLDEEGRLLVLTIEDRETIGLPGEEVEDNSHFCALCRDKLFSHKQDSSAGGSYGLGKSVLWTFSGLTTVLFLSRLDEDPSENESPRLIGRCELPYHRMSSHGEVGSFAGPGWFGDIVHVDGGQRADSVWGQPAQALGEAMSLTHDATSGTSIMVVGFRDPEADEVVGVDKFVHRIRSSATENFWPVLSREDAPLRVVIDGPAGRERVEVEDSEELKPFKRCYDARHQAGKSLEEVGDVARRDIDIEIPAKRDGGQATVGKVSLLVRLAAPADSDRRQGRVALFRGPGMVVKYWDQRQLALGARPFHAMLICGEARDFEEGAEADEAVDEFLRFAEPPGHDRWDSTAHLKDNYKQGYKKAIDDMKAAVRSALHQLVVPQPSEGEMGPDRLRKRFPLGTPSDVAPGRGESPFQFAELTGNFVDGRWDVQGSIEAVTTEHKGWRARVEMVQVREDNRPLRDAPVPLASLEIDTPGATSCLDDGRAEISAEPGVSKVDFIGWSRRIDDDGKGVPTTAGEVELRVKGELFTPEQT